MSFNEQRVGGQDFHDRQSEQTMRALRAAADRTHHCRRRATPRRFRPTSLHQTRFAPQPDHSGAS